MEVKGGHTAKDCDRSCDFCERSEREDLQLEWQGMFLTCEDCIRLSEVEEEQGM